MKTNVSIKFNSIEEYREIEKKLIELGYVNNFEHGCDISESEYFVLYSDKTFCTHPFQGIGSKKHYNSLEEFLKD